MRYVILFNLALLALEISLIIAHSLPKKLPGKDLVNFVNILNLKRHDTLINFFDTILFPI